MKPDRIKVTAQVRDAGHVARVQFSQEITSGQCVQQAIGRGLWWHILYPLGYGRPDSALAAAVQSYGHSDEMHPYDDESDKLRKDFVAAAEALVNYWDKHDTENPK